MNDTIAAIATPVGMGGIGVVRISGAEAIVIADQMLRTKQYEKISLMQGYSCAYGRVYDAEGVIDEVVVTVFRNPQSYTGEDVVEIAAHGGVYLLNRILRACCTQGARLALAGEFTKRAFLHGKLDLTQAEAVIDLISAQGKQAARAALTARDGALYRRIDEICQQLIGTAAHLAAWIDYPEEEIEQVDGAHLMEQLRQADAALEQLLKTYDTGRIIREGIQTVIAGRPNAGKSTLMNLLTGYQRSIVADVAGTTRDVVSDTVFLGDIVLHLSDTAGIRKTGDAIEQAGVEMAEERLRQAQLVLAIFDGSDSLDENDHHVINCCKDTTAIALINKNDLPQQADLQWIGKQFDHVIHISAKQQEGIDLLKQKIHQLFQLGQFDSGAAMVANERQRSGVLLAVGEVKEAISALQQGVSYDAVCVCVEQAVDALLELTGKKASQEVVEQVFARFCVGK